MCGAADETFDHIFGECEEARGLVERCCAAIKEICPTSAAELADLSSVEEGWKWFLAGGLRPFPKGTDFHKLFIAGKSVKQPVDKTKKEECKRAYTEHFRDLQ